MRGWSARLTERFWALPLVCAVLAAALGVGLSDLDDRVHSQSSLPFLFSGGPEGARAVLSAIITSMISFTGLVFSITIVVLQLTSSQFSPRVLRTFLRDRFNQTALGVFIATFVYALMVLRAVRGTAQVGPFVPQVAVTVALLFVLASVVVFLGYIHHVAESIRSATIVAKASDESRDLLDRIHPVDATAPDPTGRPTGPGRVVPADVPGVVQRIDDGTLRRWARRHGPVRLLRAVGEFVPAGSPLLRVWGADSADDDALLAGIHLGSERSPDQDLGFGLRQLVDIADRALSPGVNDPTTAIQVVDQLHDLLRRLAARPLFDRCLTDDEGRLLVEIPQPGFGQYLELSVDEVARWGAQSERVQRRLRIMLLDVAAVARPEYRPVLAGYLIRWGVAPPTGTAGDPPPSDIGLRPDPPGPARSG